MAISKFNKFDICLDCGKVRFIANRTKQLCEECNYKRLHNGKSKVEVAIEKSKLKPIKPRKATGEKELFMEIWAERPHRCVKCGVTLPEPMKAVYFSHKKSKGAFPELRLEKDNIELCCPECHYKYEFGNRK